MGERIGYLAVPRDASQPRTFFEWDQLTLKKGSVQGGRVGGQEKKSEGPNNTGQEGEP